MSGFAVLRTLRRDPLTRDIPVIMMSGNEQATEQFYADASAPTISCEETQPRFEIFSRIEHLLDPDLALRASEPPIPPRNRPSPRQEPAATPRL